MILYTYHRINSLTTTGFKVKCVTFYKRRIDNIETFKAALTNPAQRSKKNFTSFTSATSGKKFTYIVYAQLQVLSTTDILMKVDYA